MQLEQCWQRCSNYIFILDLTPGFIELGKDICNPRQETFKLGDLVPLILEILWYMKMMSIIFSFIEHPNVDPRPAVANLATVAILAVTENVPLSNFTLDLQYSLNAIGEWQQWIILMELV